MKKLLFLLIWLPQLLIAQEIKSITSDEWNQLVDYLDQEQWEEASKTSFGYLNRLSKEEQELDQAAMLRYMYLLSQSGMMNDRKLSKDEAFKNVKEFKGKTLILPGHPLETKQGFNVIHPANNRADTLMITQSNHKATNILCFEYVILENKLSMAEFEMLKGKIGRVKGKLKSIHVHGNFLPRFQLFITKATMEVE
ncbi:hypothetical protein QNI19_29785 [Cytophagaceae bacterium DM2B3-1]|uniref:DUF4919 domain-containing protein n=1 Tax=Xanthocytophaga flava TaxID=3048013 RepID=A0ABT7CW64_9BACT|nr:hypothetical protein [Xanthocytophaga flavus]MDJ1471811.1 hypothetical protein [Xanthocytophaga flavus]MDJ1497167.1 hypothetical protein [Xanthocytophaga flavus]